ncbi:MAG: S9 family peptidase [Acidobacteria bacterium]|nr:S9 family peptidase [Acidobacteriota bacterium]
MRRLAAFFAFAVLLCAAPAPITHEDVWLMKRVGAPALSPDGKWVVVSVVEPAYEADKQVTDLWIVPADGSAPPRRLTSTKGGESGAEWSPDSSRIAFSARREGDEVSQIYVLPLQGGEAQRVTSLSTGAFSPKWRPDGKALLFQSTVYPGAADEEANQKVAAERKARKYKARVFELFPIQYWDRWLDDLRPHIFVQELDPGAKARDLLAGTKLVREIGFDAPRGGSGESDLQAVWAPDGQSVVFTATVTGNVGAYAIGFTNLYQAPAAGGEPRALTSGPDSFSRPAFRPDGKALYAIHSRRSETRLYSLSRLAMLEWPAAGQPVLVTGKWDRSVDGFEFTPDSRTIYLIAEEHGLDPLFRMPAAGGEVRPALDMKEGGYSGLAIGGTAAAPVIVASWGSMIHPPDVVRIDPAAGKHRLLTGFNAARIAQIDWQPPRHFWFTATNGRRIHSLLVLPANFDPSKKYPLVLFPHGGPNNMSKDQFFIRWNYHLLTAPGYVLLMTNYTGSTGFGEDFAEAIHRDLLRGPGQEILEAADGAARQFPFVDASRMAAAGASYGGYLMAWFAGNTDRFRCLVNHAGLSDNISMWGATDGAYYWELRNGGPIWDLKGPWMDQNPMKYAASFKTPMLITHGERDFRVPLSQGFMMYKLMQRQRVPVRLVIFPDENHWVLSGENARYHMQEVLAWLKKYL